MRTASRKVMDCRRVAGSTCTLTIAGTEKEVLDAAMAHAVRDHGAPDTPAMRERLKDSLQPETAGRRSA